MARVIDLPDLPATEALAARLAALMRPGDTVLLEGPLGAGKSTLARALLRALVGDPALEVPSPTFTLVQGYDTPIGLVQHFDLWRLDGPDAPREGPWQAPREAPWQALGELGWEEGDAALVEWPDRLGPLRPDDALVVELIPGAGDARRARLAGWEDRS